MINLEDYTLIYDKQAVCEDCGEDIEEPIYLNKEGKTVHITSATVGHYFNDGTARCDGCHDGYF